MTHIPYVPICRDVNCNMTDLCDECREWSSDTMTTYLSYKRTLASKRSKKPQPAPVSQLAVTGSSVGPSSVSSSALADGDSLREAVLSAIQSLSQTGRLGTNPLPSTASFPVPDSESHWVSSGGDGSHQPHNVGGKTRTSAVGACVVSTENSTTPSVPISVSHNVSLSHRSSQGMSHSLGSHDSAFLGSQFSQSLGLGVDQLRVSEGGSLGPSSSLSPTSLMFPFPDFGFSSLPASSTSLAPSALPSVSSSSSPSLFLCSSSSCFHPSSFVRSFFRVYNLFSFVFLALLFSPSFRPFGVLFLFLVFLLLFGSTVGFSFLLLLLLLLLASHSSRPLRPFFLSLLLLLCFLRSLRPLLVLLSLLLSLSLRFHPLPLCIPLSGLLPHQLGWRLIEKGVLGLSNDYQSLARWFVHSAGMDFAGLIRSSFPHLLPDFTRDSVSGSSLFLAALRSESSSSFLSAPPPPSSLASTSYAYPSSSSWPAAPPPSPPSAHLSSHRSSVVAGLSHLSSTFHTPLLPHPPAPSFAPPTSSAALPPPPVVLAPASSHPPMPSYSASPSLPSSAVRAPSDVPGWGVGPPFPSGVSPIQSYASVPPAPHAPTWTPASALAYDPHAFAHSLPRPDDYDDPDDCLPDDDLPPLDPSAPSLALDLHRSEYRRLLEYICGLFPQAVGVPPVDPLPRALFKSFFVPAPHSQTLLAFNWFTRVQQALVDADSCLAVWIAAGCSGRAFLPSRHSTYAVRGPHAADRAVPVNESLLSHYDRPLRPSLQVGLTVCDLMSLEHSFRAQSESLSYVMWVLSGLLGSSAYRASLLPIPPYSINLSRLYQRVWLTRCMLPPPIPSTPAINVGSFTYSICPPSSLTLRSAPSCRLCQYLRIPSFVRRMFASCWTRRVRLCPSGHNRSWWTWFFAAPLRWLVLAVQALDTHFLALPCAAAVSPPTLLPDLTSGFISIRWPLLQL